jgi:superfamily I DNA/RNA helicase
MKTNIRLDDQQSRIVYSENTGAILVVAGAGSGKTAVAVETIVEKAKRKIETEAMLLITFSRKAEIEMKTRLKLRMEEECLINKVVVNTYHGLGWSLIRENPESFNREKGVTLMDEVDSKKLMDFCIKEANSTLTRTLVLSMYEKLSQEGLLKKELEQEAIKYIEKKIVNPDSEPEEDKPAINPEEVLWMINYFQNTKKKSNIVDYEDLLLLPVIALESNKTLQESISNKYKFVIADESQDTNGIQYQLIRLIMPPSRMHEAGIMFVGDDDQSIYVWRGAKPNNLLQFKNEYNARVYPLERNYRCNRNIVSAAAELISNNTQRLDKTPFSVRDGHKPVAHVFENTYEMARYVAQASSELMSQGVEASDIAILYRNNMMATFLEPAMVAESVPYQVYKGSDFTTRTEIQLALAFIRLVVNNRDSLAGEKIAKLMPGIGQAAIIQAIHYSQEHYTSFLEGASLAWKGEKKVLALEWIAKIKYISTQSPIVLGTWLMKKEGAGLYDYLRNSALKEKEAKKAINKLNRQIEHLKLLTDALYSRINFDDPVEKQWNDALDVLLTPPDEDQDRTGVTLSTIHKSKGLEFRYVFIFGLNSEFFENTSYKKKEAITEAEYDEDVMENLSKLEESRRLAYVAFTRAKDVLIILSAKKMALGSMERQLKPSRFLFESGVMSANKPAISAKADRSRMLWYDVQQNDILNAMGIKE